MSSINRFAIATTGTLNSITLTIDEIHTLAEEKYGIVRTRRVNGVLIKGDCELTRRLKRRAKADYIKKLMIQYGHKQN